MTQGIQVVFALYDGDRESRRKIGAAIHKALKAKPLRIDISTPIELIARETMGLPAMALEKRDIAFVAPIHIREEAIRRIINKVHTSLVDKDSFNPRKIGINMFRKFVLNTPKDMLRFIGFEVIRKVYPDFTIMAACKNALGKAGNFVVEGVKFHDEFTYLENMFQLVYPIKIKAKTLPKVDKNQVDDYAFIREDLSDIKPFETIANKNEGDNDKAAQALCLKIETDVNKRIESPEGIKEMIVPQTVVANAIVEQAKGSSDKIVTEKAIFSRKEHRWTDDEVIV